MENPGIIKWTGKSIILSQVHSAPRKLKASEEAVNSKSGLLYLSLNCSMENYKVFSTNIR